ncbi:Tetratricopeptide repeat domain containing protein [Balamuthia mandrillaris]
MSPSHLPTNAYDYNNQEKLAEGEELAGQVYRELGHVTKEDRPIAAATFFAAHLRSQISVPNTNWLAIAQTCFSIAQLLKALDLLELASQLLNKAVPIFVQGPNREEEAKARELLQEIDSLLAKKPSVQELDTSKKFEESSSESESDWDKDEEEDWGDFELDMGGAGLSLGGLMRDSEESDVQNAEATDEILPARYKLLDDDQNIKIKKFPKPTFLFSLRTKDGERRLHEEELEVWLKTLITKHPVMHLESNTSSAEELCNDFYGSVVYLVKFSPQWARLYLDFCQTMYLRRSLGACWKAVTEFFDAYSARKGASSEMEVSEEMDFILQVLHLANKLWTPERDDLYCKMHTYIRSFVPDSAQLLHLIQAETYSHHGYDKSKRNEAEDSPLTIFCQVYRIARQTHQRVPTLQSGGKGLDHNDLQGLALMDLHLHLNYISPLTTFQKEEEEEEEEETYADYYEYADIDGDTEVDYGSEAEEEGQTSTARKNQGKAEFSPRGGIRGSNLAFSDDSPSADLAGDSVDGTNDLADPQERIKRLEEIYPAMNHPFYKAKAAYVLGYHYMNVEQDFQKAESLFFESIYLLDQCPPPGVPGLVPIVSELGTNALQAYGSVTLKNFKYTYSILAHNAALTNYYLRSKKAEYYSLLNQLAQIARVHNDHKRALLYLKEMLAKYTEEKKINEMIYVSELLSKQYAEIGQFIPAEEDLTQALHNLKDSHSDPRKLKLQLELAQFFLESAQPEQAIQLLSNVLRMQELPHEKQCQALELMCQSYIMKQWFPECNRSLERLANLGTPSAGGVEPEVDGIGARSSSSYWYLRGSNYYHSSLLCEALVCIDMAIHTCPRQSLGMLGKYFLTRGKILQSLCSHPQLTFPTSLDPLQLDEDTQNYLKLRHLHNLSCSSPASSLSSASSSYGPSSTRSSSSSYSAPLQRMEFSCAGDLLQEAVATFDKAYDYFQAAGDDMQLAKVLSHIAETYIAYLFGPVALLRFPYEERARLPVFKVSAIASKVDATEEEENKRAVPEPKTSSPDPAPATTTVHASEEPSKRDSSADDSSSEDFEEDFDFGEAPLSLPSKLEDPEGDDEDDDDFGDEEESEDVFITFESIENPALYSLDICAETCNVMLMLTGYMNMAELRYLQDRITEGLAFWRECRDHLLLLFMDGPHVLLQGAPPKFLRKLQHLLKRVLRFMFCFESELINKNLMLIDAYLLLHIELEQALKRPITSMPSSDGIPEGTRKELQPLSRLPTKILDKQPSLFSPSTTGESAADVFRSHKFLFENREGLPAIIAAGSSPKKATEQVLPRSKSGKARQGADSITSYVWGCLRCIKNFINKYTAGQITQEEMLRRNRATIRKLARTMHSIRLRHQRTKKGTTPRGLAVNPYRTQRRVPHFSRSPRSFYGGVSTRDLRLLLSQSSAGLASPREGIRTTFLKEQETKSSEYSFAELASRPLAPGNLDMNQLVYILLLDDYMIFYVPQSGKKRIHRLAGGGSSTQATTPLINNNTTGVGAVSGTAGQVLKEKRLSGNSSSENESGSEKDGPQISLGGSFPTLTLKAGSKLAASATTEAQDHNIKYLSVALMHNTEEHITFQVTPYTTLDTVLSYLCNRNEWSNQIGGGSEPGSASPSPLPSPDHGRGRSGSGDELLIASPSFSSSSPSSASSSSGSGGPPPSPKGSNPLSSPAFTSYAKLYSKFHFVQRTQNFYVELAQWLDFFGGSITEQTFGELHQAGDCFVVPPLQSSASQGSNLSPASKVRGHRRTRSSSAMSSTAISTSAQNLGLSGRSTAASSLAYQCACLAKKLSVTSEQTVRTAITASTSLVPLTERMRSTVSECFSPQELANSTTEKPLQLFLYFSARPTPPLAEMSSSGNSLFRGNRTVFLTDPVVEYLSSLLLPVKASERQPARAQTALVEMANSVFSSLLEIIPQAVPEKQGSTAVDTSSKPSGGFLTKQLKKLTSYDKGKGTKEETVLVTSPMMLVCSQALQVFPWELILGQDCIMRSFSLHHFLQLETKQEDKPIPRYISFYNASSDKHVLQEEEEHKEWLVRRVRQSLNVPKKPVDVAVYSQKNALLMPFHTPLTKQGKLLNKYRRRYKHLSFCDVSELLSKPSSISHSLERNSELSDFHPICLFTYADLLDTHLMILTLLRWNKKCTMLFVPASHLKELTERLMKSYEALKSSSKSRTGNIYHSLMATIHSFQEEHLIPIAIINAPSPHAHASLLPSSSASSAIAAAAASVNPIHPGKKS